MGAGRVTDGRLFLRCWWTRGMPVAAAVTLAAVTLAAGGGRAGAATAGTGQPVAAGTISTVAGGVGGPGPAKNVAVIPFAVSYTGGSLYIASLTSVREVNTSTGYLTTPAGTGWPGGGSNSPANQTGLFAAEFATADGAGNVVIADTDNNQIQVVAKSNGTFYGQKMTAKHIYRVAGNGAEGRAGDGGPARAAKLHYPGGVAVDSAGNLVIADTVNQEIRVVAESTGTFYGQAMTANDIYTVAGNGQIGNGGRGGPATSAQLDYPTQVAVDGAGNLLIADAAANRILVVADSTGTFYGQAMTAGDIYNVAGDGHPGFSGDGGPARTAELTSPTAVTVDAAGNLVIADNGNNRVRVVADSTGTFYGQAMTAHHIYTVAGTGAAGFSGGGGPATSAKLNGPNGVAVDGSGNLVIADTNNNRIRVVAATTGRFYGQEMTAGDIYVVAGAGTAGFYGSFSGDGGLATRAELNQPTGVTVDAAGNQVIADTVNNRIRVVAESTGTFYGQAMTAGDIYTVAGDGTAGYSGDGGPATSAELNDPEGVTVDAAGNLVIADEGNHRVRVAAESTGTFYGQAMTAGDIYTVAGDGTAGYSGDGGPATSAELAGPSEAAVDRCGNLVIADQGNNRIRVVAESTGTFYGQAMTAGDIYTVAGDGTAGYSGDGGPATSAELNAPSGVTLDAAGNLVIADQGNNRVRVAAECTGTFYGQAMTAGDIYTVAGDGGFGFSGDGGPATEAELGFGFGFMVVPAGVAVDAAGNLLIAADNRIRMVTG